MLRIQHKTDAKAVKEYMRQSDYYLETPGEWMGKGAERLGLTGQARHEDFEALCDNLRPDGSPLTALTVDGRRIGADFNFNAVKSVGIAREIIGHSDPAEGRRIEDAHREAVAFAMGFIERDMRVRDRDGGKNEDHVTGNLIAMRVTHRTTRPNEDDYTPDMSLHDHVFVINASFDDGAGGKAKATELGRIKHDAPYYEALYHNRLAANLKAMGYGIRRKGKGFELAGIDDATIEKFSRRKATIEKLAEKLGITGADARGKLGATSRLRKEDSRLVDLAPYWLGKLTDEERDGIRDLRGHNSYRGDAEAGMRYAIDHLFYRNSVVEARQLYETAIRHAIGWVTPEEIEVEAKRQGVLFQGDKVSTRDVLAQERRIIGFARAGRGKFTPLAPGKTDGLEGLSEEQANAVKHVWNSADRIMLIRGAPGAGKTTMMRPALDRLGAPAVLLAPSSDASRGKLREDGFEQANTVAAFLGEGKEGKAMRERARGGIIWIDEASLLAIDDLERVCGAAKDLKARIVLQGDPKQHKAVQRHGNMLRVLADYAGLKVAEINTIRRQQGAYAAAVKALHDGEYEKGVDLLYTMGAIIEGEGHDKLVEHYAAAVAEAGARGEKLHILIGDPTHKDGGALTEKLRQVRKDAGLVRGQERTFARWTALGWTPAQRGDAAQYAGDEVIQFFHDTGTFKAGQRVGAEELLPRLGEVDPGHFEVYRAGEVAFAVGDAVRITTNGRDVTGKHRVDNGRIDTIKGFARNGDMILSNGWRVSKDFAHWRHGLVSTSYASQSKDDVETWQQWNRASLGAMGAEQGLVSISRGKKRVRLFTDLSREELIDAIRRADNRLSATELFRPNPQASAAARVEDGMRRFLERVRGNWRQTQRRLEAARVRPAPVAGEQERQPFAQRFRRKEAGHGLAR